MTPNATHAFNTVLRNIVWDSDGKDEILYFSTIYSACGKTIDYICEYNRNLVNPRRIDITYPLEDTDYLAAFKDAIAASKASGHRPKLATFDTICSIPGVRVPFEQLTVICKSEGILSLIDGAHGIGHIPLNLSTLQPDFFLSNAHKWLFAPRGCCPLYVPMVNQHLIRSTLPTSHGFIPQQSQNTWPDPLPPKHKSAFVNNFEFVGTVDASPFLCLPEAIKWRKEVCGGEEAIMQYCTELAGKGGKIVAEILGTKVLDNKTETLTGCCFANVLLPIVSWRNAEQAAKTVENEGGEYGDAEVVGVPAEDAVKATLWMQKTLVNEQETFLAIFPFQQQYWVRLSAQVYLDEKDFEWTGKVLKDICKRVGKGEYKEVAASATQGVKEPAVEGAKLARHEVSEGEKT